MRQFYVFTLLCFLSSFTSWISCVAVTPPEATTLTTNSNFTTLPSTWTKSNAPVSNWLKVVSDATGKIVLGVGSVKGNSLTGIYLSTDFGTTFTNIFVDGCGANEPWTGVAMSSDGYIFYAIQQNLGIYYSYNQGRSWTRTILDPSSMYAYYNGVSCSSSGSNVYVIYGSGGIIYSSSNFGYTFTKTTLQSNWWQNIISSPSGQTVLALGHEMYLSTNAGYSWAKVSSAPSQNWFDASFSSTGNIVVASAGGDSHSDYAYGGVYLSLDSGKTWKLLSSVNRSLDWSGIRIDGNGKFIYAAVNGGDLYYSADQGLTFQKVSSAPSGEAWRAITCDTTATLCALASYSNGHIYYSSA